ncbi:MAG: cysteine--tRNA ligase [Methanobacteriota archaeon]|nr:MAG: cysteine--tRNA ligase [Euryarchaeota archaeon]
MGLRVYNTLSRQKEEFVPLRGKRVHMFVCGLTPQDHAHVGHAKTYVAFDVVAKYLRQKGYRVFYLQNVTDVEDRIIEKMAATGKAWQDIVQPFFREYEDAMAALNVTAVDVYAWATDYMHEIVEQIRGLIDRGFAYVAEDGSVYYDTTKYKGWGQLSGQKVEKNLPGARVAVEERKRNPADFALWKAQKPGEPSWDSPWGKGRPGWHIEDTAITIRHFGPQYDIHGGATELMFPHHEAEIAQAEAFTGVKPFVKYWMHGGMLMVRGEEMHKSLGNYWALKDALAQFDGEVLRFFLVNAHYRSPIDFTLEGLEEAKSAYARLADTIANLEAELRSAPEPGIEDPSLRAAAKRARETFETAMDDDFNTREALAGLFDLANAVNRSSGKVGREALADAWATFDASGAVLGLWRRPKDSGKGLAGDLIDALVELREDARKRKDFATSDRIRDVLAARGVVLEDTKSGVRWKAR